jgi:hypothetical protein
MSGEGTGSPQTRIGGAGAAGTVHSAIGPADRMGRLGASDSRAPTSD